MRFLQGELGRYEHSQPGVPGESAREWTPGLKKPPGSTQSCREGKHRRAQAARRTAKPPDACLQATTTGSGVRNPRSSLQKGGEETAGEASYWKT